MTDKKYIIALDQGTTSSRAVLLDHNANVVEIAQREFTQIYPRAGWVEHNPMEIWATQSSTLNEVVAKAGITVVLQILQINLKRMVTKNISATPQV